MNSVIPSPESTDTSLAQHSSTVPFPEAAPVPVRRRRWYSWERWGGKFLVLSVAAHLLFGAVAAYLVVQTIQAKRKLTFQSGPKGPNAPTRALEHKVQMKKQKSALSAPPQAKRVTTTGLSKVALPDMPAMPSMTATLTPGAISGMGATGIAPGGLGSVGGMGGGGGGAAINFFGARTGGIGLTGTIFDLKQDRSHKPTGMDPARYGTIISQFVKGGFNEAFFAPYFKGEKPLYAPQIFTPRIVADEGPKAFGLQNIVQPKMWCVVYRGRVVAPESGSFHFVGIGDDVLVVRFDNKIVLDHGSASFSGIKPQHFYHYAYDPEPWYSQRGHGVGEKIEVLAGTTHSIEVLIGEQPGGKCEFTLLMEKEGADYKKDAAGNPILPIFRMADVRVSLPATGMIAPHENNGPVWRTEAAKPASFFDAVR